MVYAGLADIKTLTQQRVATFLGCTRISKKEKSLPFWGNMVRKSASTKDNLSLS